MIMPATMGRPSLKVGLSDKSQSERRARFGEGSPSRGPARPLSPLEALTTEERDEEEDEEEEADEEEEVEEEVEEEEKEEPLFLLPAPDPPVPCRPVHHLCPRRRQLSHHSDSVRDCDEHVRRSRRRAGG